MNTNTIAKKDRKAIVFRVQYKRHAAARLASTLIRESRRVVKFVSIYITYILKSVEYDKTYVGITDNIDRRINQHNNGYNTYSKRYKPWKIIHTEPYQNRKNARVREKYLKSCAGRKWINKHLFK